jgi:hypothetical protein
MSQPQDSPLKDSPLKEWPPKAELEALRRLYEALPAIKARPDGPYTFADESRDFWAVFNTDAGKRVLARIAGICDPVPVGPGQARDHGQMAFQAGMRWVMHMINLSFAGRGAPPQQNSEDK